MGSHYSCSEEHKCQLCRKYGHEADICIYASPDKLVAQTSGKIYVINYIGMGCYIFYRRNGSDMPFDVFLMHNDAWGQYGYSHVPELKRFLQGYKPFREIDKIDI